MEAKRGNKHFNFFFASSVAPPLLSSRKLFSQPSSMLFITFPSLLYLILCIGFSVYLLIHLCFILLIKKKYFLWGSSHWRTQDFFKMVFSYITRSSLPPRQFTFIPYILVCWKNIQLLLPSEIFPSSSPGVLKSPFFRSGVFMLLCLGLLLLEEPSVPGFPGHFHQAALPPSNPFLSFN